MKLKKVKITDNERNSTLSISNMFKDDDEEAVEEEQEQLQLQTEPQRVLTPITQLTNQISRLRI